MRFATTKRRAVSIFLTCAIVEKDASLWLVVVLQLALPSEVPGYVLGVAKYPLGRYLMALAIAELPYALATTYIGAGFNERRSGLIMVTGVAVALLCLAAVHALRRAMRTSSVRW